MDVDAVAASQLRTIVFNATQGSQSLALGLTLAAASQLFGELFSTNLSFWFVSLRAVLENVYAQVGQWFASKSSLSKLRGSQVALPTARFPTSPKGHGQHWERFWW